MRAGQVLAKTVSKYLMMFCILVEIHKIWLKILYENMRSNAFLVEMVENSKLTGHIYNNNI